MPHSEMAKFMKKFNELGLYGFTLLASVCIRIWKYWYWQDEAMRFWAPHHNCSSQSNQYV